jgi:tol-pal system protein YbgF
MKSAAYICILSILLVSVPSAKAGTKEELQRLQRDVLALQNQIRQLEQAFTEQTQGLRSLVIQLNDQVGKTTLLLDRMSTAFEAQASGDQSTSATLLDEVRALSRKMDDTGTSLSAISQQIADIKVQSKPMTQRTYQTAPADPQRLAFSADEIFHQAFNDLVQGNLDFAIEGFKSFLQNFPSNEKADDAQYNIGEAYYGSGKYSMALAAFTRVLEEYPEGDKIASSHFKRARVHLALGDKESAIEDFKTVVEKHPDAPEAGLARSELTNLGIEVSENRRGSSKRKPR